MSDVFISYKRQERARAQLVADALRSLDLDVWFDRRLPIGAAFKKAILTEARAAKVIVVCWSRLSVESDWVCKEAEVGFSRVNLAPITFEECRPPLPFSTLNHADLAEWKGDMGNDAWLHLLEKVEPLTGRHDLVMRSREMESGRREELVERSRALLIRIARSGGTLTYEDAAKQLGVREDDLTTLYSALDMTAEQNRRAREPLLCSLVVHHDTGIPGKGYFQKQLLLEGAESTLAREIWREHCRRVYEHAWGAD